MQKLLVSFAALVTVAFPAAAFEVATKANGYHFVAPRSPRGSKNPYFIMPLDPSDPKGSPLVRQQTRQHETICFYEKRPPVAIVVEESCPKFAAVASLNKPHD